MHDRAELDTVDDGWDAPFPFGHENDRRLGVRGAVRCWAVLKGIEGSVYARVHELSTTGLVLKVVEGRLGDTFRLDQLFVLDLLLGGTRAPIHTMVRHVRPVGAREALEFLVITATDRLTLAEYLDAPAGAPGTGSASRPSRHPELWYLSLIARGAGRPAI